MNGAEVIVKSLVDKEIDIYFANAGTTEQPLSPALICLKANWTRLGYVGPWQPFSRKGQS